VAGRLSEGASRPSSIHPSIHGPDRVAACQSLIRAASVLRLAAGCCCSSSSFAFLVHHQVLPLSCCCSSHDPASRVYLIQVPGFAVSPLANSLTLPCAVPLEHLSPIRRLGQLVSLNHNHNHETTTAPPVSRILCCALRRTLTHTRTVAHTVRSTCACYRVARAARHSSDGSAGGREHGERLISRRQRLAIVVVRVYAKEYVRYDRLCRLASCRNPPCQPGCGFSSWQLTRWSALTFLGAPAGEQSALLCRASLDDLYPLRRHHRSTITVLYPQDGRTLIPYPASSSVPVQSILLGTPIQQSIHPRNRAHPALLRQKPRPTLSRAPSWTERAILPIPEYPATTPTPTLLGCWRSI